MVKLSSGETISFKSKYLNFKSKEHLFALPNIRLKHDTFKIPLNVNSALFNDSLFKAYFLH